MAVFMGFATEWMIKLANIEVMFYIYKLIITTIILVFIQYSKTITLSLIRKKIGADFTMTSEHSECLPLPHTKGTKPAPSSVKVLVYLMQVK